MTAKATSTVKHLRNTYRKDRAIAKPLTSDRLDVPPPATAGMSDAARLEWDRLAATLVDLGNLRGADLRALQLLAETLASVAAFAALVDRDGPTVTTRDGGSKAHPATQALATARAQARNLLQDFGLTPKARQSVDAAPVSRSNPYDEFTPARRQA